MSTTPARPFAAILRRSAKIIRHAGSHHPLRTALVAALLGSAAICSPARAGIVYDESINGDFSNAGLSPTAVTLAAGWNTILGSTGRGSAGVDRDYFTIHVPWNFTFNSVTELAGTQAGGAVSFLGIESGTQLTLPTNPPNATGLLGWTHYASTGVNVDLFPLLDTPSDGSTGFTPPLGAGDYTFWIQDFNTGPINYGFALEIVPVPEPSTYALGGGALLLLLVVRRRFSAKRDIP